MDLVLHGSFLLYDFEESDLFRDRGRKIPKYGRLTERFCVDTSTGKRSIS